MINHSVKKCLANNKLFTLIDISIDGYSTHIKSGGYILSHNPIIKIL